MASQLLASHQQCTWRCRSQQHASQLASAITKSSSINDRQLKIYIALSCPNASRSVDSGSGRTLVHWAATSNERTDVLEWLLDDLAAEIEAKDLESGYTPLHRALLHGQLASAQALIDRGAQLNIFDHEGLTPLQIVRRDQKLGGYSLTGPTEVYSCGENATSNLGHRVPTERILPDLVDFFSRRSISVLQVAMSKWHTAFVCADGGVYTCGRGSFGRLGHGDLNDRTVPTRVQIPNETCRSVAVGDEHTVIITANGSAWAWGGNRRRQLGLNSPTELLSSPHLITLSKNVKDHKFTGCACGDWYTIIWTAELIYCCGSNDGQFGPCAPKNEQNVGQLRQITAVTGPFVGADILDIACGDSAVAILTTKRDVYLLDNFECRRILSRVLDLTRVIMNSTGVKKSDRQQQHQQQQQQQQPSVSHPLIRLTFFSTGGNVYYWDTKDQHLRRCLFTGNVKRMIYPLNGCAFGSDGLFLITPDGAMYKGRLKEFSKAALANAGEEAEKFGGFDEKHHGKKPTPSKASASAGDKASKKASSSHTTWTSTRPPAAEEAGAYFAFRKTGPFLELSECQVVVLSSSVHSVHRAIAVSSASDGRNFCVIQQNPKADLTELPYKPPGTMLEEYGALLQEMDVSDFLHDIQLRISENGAQFRAAHKFILCSRCPYFAKRIQASTTHLEIEEPAHVVTEAALNRILDYIYTDDCDLFRIGPLLEHVDASGSENEAIRKQAKDRDPVRELLEAAKRLNMKILVKRLETLRWDASTRRVVQASRHQPIPAKIRFEPNAFPEFCDVRLRCKNKVHISTHRCVLAARSEYFRCMFASGWWSETGRDQTLNVDVESDILAPVLYYLYTDELPPYSIDDEVKKRKNTLPEEAHATVDKDILEHYGRVLVCADQWLLDRLRRLCEIELAARITLRNAADMMDFALTINADQLFASCCQFISLNLCSLLESNAFRNTSVDCLRRVGAYYRQMYPHVGHRAMTPSSHPPSVGDIESAWQDVQNSGLDPDDILQEYSNALARHQAAGDSPTASGGHGKKKRVPTTPRARRTSAAIAQVAEEPSETPRVVAKTISDQGSPAPMAISKVTEEIREMKKATWAKTQVPIETGISNASMAKTQPIAVPSAGRLPLRPRNKPWNLAQSPTDQYPEVSLRDLMQAEEKQASAVAERKKSSTPAMVIRQPSSPPLESKPSQPAWTTVSPPSFMSTIKPTPGAFPALQQHVVQPSGTAKMKQDVFEEKKRGFNEIVLEEKSKEAARARILNKPLKIIQDEELAIQELTLIYQIDDNWDEFITVERASASVAEPTWQAHVGSPTRF